MLLSLKVKGISGNMYTTSEYAILDLYIPSKDLKTNKLVQAVITKEFHLIKGLQANILVRIDTIMPKKAILDLSSKLITLSSYDIVVLI